MSHGVKLFARVTRFRGRASTPLEDQPVEDRPAEPDAEDSEARVDEVPADEAPVDEAPATPEADAPEEPVDGYEVVAVEPAQVSLELARRLAALDRAEMLAAGRDLAVPSGGALLAELQALDGGLWIAGPGERPLSRPLGWAMLGTRDGRARLHGSVARDQRANGIGNALLSAALAKAAEDGHSAVEATVWEASEGEEFLWRHGFSERGRPSTMRRLEVVATKARRRRIVEDAQAYGAAYQLLREIEETDEHGGCTVFRVRSRHAATGATAGHAELAVLGGAPEHAQRGVMHVEAGHRGNRLGVLMLGDLLQWLETEQPRVRVAHSSVPANDTHTIAVLDRLGCRIAGVQVELRRTLR
jgi:GNAT superfamily N-acetyltransferase